MLRLWSQSLNATASRSALCSSRPAITRSVVGRQQVRFNRHDRFRNENYGFNPPPPRPPSRQEGASRMVKILVGGALLGAAATWAAYELYWPKHKYPKEVADLMRMALKHSAAAHPQRKNFELAMKKYEEAIQTSKEIGMDPLSDEVLGLKAEYGITCLAHGSLEKAELLFKDTAESLREELQKLKMRGIKFDRMGGVHVSLDDIGILLSGVEMARLDDPDDPRVPRLVKWFVRYNVQAYQVLNLLTPPGLTTVNGFLDLAASFAMQDKLNRVRQGVVNPEAMLDTEISSVWELRSFSHLARGDVPQGCLDLRVAANVLPKNDCHSYTLQNNVGAYLTGLIRASSVRDKRSAEGQVKDMLKQALEDLVGLPEETKSCTPCLMARGMLMSNMAELESSTGNEQASRRLYAEARTIFSQIPDFNMNHDAIKAKWEERAPRLQTGSDINRAWNPELRFLRELAERESNSNVEKP